MEQTWRWFGEQDPISLDHVRQAGATGIVTALHHVPSGRAWSAAEIAHRQATVAAAGLNWSVCESIPVPDAVKLGAGTTVFVMVRAGQHTPEWLERFAETVRKIPEIVEFYRMTGEVDYLLKVRVADIAGYDRVYKQLIRSAPLTDVSGAFAMEELKLTTSIPLPPH